MQQDNRYDYSQAGFSPFLTRSIDDVGQSSLGVDINPQSRQMAYDRGSVSGGLGDSLRIGTIQADGRTSLIGVKDSLQMGETENGAGVALFDNQRNTILDIVKDNKGRARLAVTDDNGLKQLYAGRFPDGKVRIKLAQAGFDVESATDDQLVWSSDFRSFKIVDDGIGQAPAVTTASDGTNTNSGFATNSYPHNLGYTPLIMAFVEVSPSQYSLMPYSEVTSANDPSGGIVSSFYRITASSTNVEIFHYVVSYAPGIGTGTYPAVNVKYYLLRETAS